MDIKKARDELRRGKTIYDMQLRVAYYGRVSTDKDDQLNSLENQQNYFEDMIRDNKNWIFTRGYIDEGISGTAVKNRDSFLQMIEDATYGKIDLILTKEISRFSRNTVDSIKYTEYLLKKGVIVYFLSDNLNTIQEDAEFRLTIMSSMAQDEVRKLSERVKFGVRRMIKDRKLIGGNLTGYYKKDGKYVINPNESPIIEFLFNTYASGNVGLKKIGELLYEKGYKNSRGEAYSQATLARMLSNPRYKGYYTARLTEVEDYKTHKKKKLPKEENVIEKSDIIPAIVSEELWDKANLLHNERKKLLARHVLNTDDHLKFYKYSCKLYCKDCDEIFIRNAGGTRADDPTWACKVYKNDGVKHCASPILRESQLDRIFIDLFTEIISQKKNFFSHVLDEYKNLINKNFNNLDLEELKKQIEAIDYQKDKLLDLIIEGVIDNSEFKKRNDKLTKKLNELQSKLDEYNDSNAEITKLEKKLKTLESCINSKMSVKDNLPYLIRLFIDKIVVEKVNGDRRHVKLNIAFDFNTPNLEVDLSFDSPEDYKINLLKKNAIASCSRHNPLVVVCSCGDTKQPGLCSNGAETWKRNTI